MKNNGLKTFEFHVQDNNAAFNAMRTERSSFSSFALINSGDLASLDSETAARKHLQLAISSPSLPQLTAPTVNGIKSEFKLLGSDVIAFTGTKTVKFRQTYNKIPIYGSLVTVELDDKNELLAINSSLGEPANIDPVAKVSPAQALNTVSRLAGHNKQPFDITPRLCYYYDSTLSRWRLTYVFEDVPKLSSKVVDRDLLQQRKPTHGNSFSFHSSTIISDFLIDAHTGDLIAEFPRTPSIAEGYLGEGLPSINPGPLEEEEIDGLGVRRKFICFRDENGRMSLHDNRYNVHTHNLNFQDINSPILPGQYVVNPPTPWDGGGISAHANAVAVAEFLQEVLLRNGIDNMGSPILSSINCIIENESSDGKEWRNAAWIGTQMVYGQRMVNGQMRSYAVALDVVAHEIFHGVTDRTSRLQYAGESGALNESYSDIFGVIISNWQKQTINEWNWQMGEELDKTGIPIRDMSNPRKYDQPDHMRNYQNLPITQFGDWGGVHINSGIHNKAAYNIITSKNDNNELLFSPKDIAILFYLTLTQHLSRTSRFKDSRRGAQLVAYTLFRNDVNKDAKIAAISEGFQAVGIV